MRKRKAEANHRLCTTFSDKKLRIILWDGVGGGVVRGKGRRMTFKGDIFLSLCLILLENCGFPCKFNEALANVQDKNITLLHRIRIILLA